MITPLNFNPLPSCEGRRCCGIYKKILGGFQSTPLMRGETEAVYISSTTLRNFNPLPSCEGRRASAKPSPSLCAFQSTPLMRGETAWNTFIESLSTFQSTPLMRGETDAEIIRNIDGQTFQSTPLMRGETRAAPQPAPPSPISIHSPHARGDLLMA